MPDTDCDGIYGSFNDTDEANKACYQDSDCVAIVDSFCDNKEFKLCNKESDIKYSTIQSCAFIKGNSL